MTLTLVPLLTLSTSTMNEVTQSLRDRFRLHENIIRDLEDHVAELQRETSIIENDIEWALENALLCHFSYQEHAFFTRERHQFYPKVHRTIDSFISNEARSFTGFTKSELRKLLLHWSIPYSAICNHQIIYGEESMIIFLYLLRKGHFYTGMCGAGVFGGDPRSFSNIIFWIVNYMYTAFYHKIADASLSMWLPHWVDHFMFAIWERFDNGYVEELQTLADGAV